jgi:hypothetical protein
MNWFASLFNRPAPPAAESPSGLSDCQSLILSYAKDYGRVFWSPRAEQAAPPATFHTPGQRRAIKALVDKGYLQPETCGWTITPEGRSRLE